VLYRFAGGSDGANPVGGLVFDQAGNIYGTTQFGGNYQGCSLYGCGTVYELKPSGSGWTKSIIYSFNYGNGAYPTGNLIFDANGSLYGTTSQGGNAYGNVYKLTPSGGGWTQSVLYTFQGHGCGSPDGEIPQGGVIFDALGNLYGTTAAGGPDDGGTVFELTPVGGSWTETVLHSFVGTCGYEPGPRGELVMGVTGNLYGTTWGSPNNYGTVFELTPSGSGWTYIDLHDFGACGSDGCYPYGGVAVDGNGNVFGTAGLGGAYGPGVVFEITH
jgi:uncharacterized repeat protein (TIGR03803 family)